MFQLILLAAIVYILYPMAARGQGASPAPKPRTFEPPQGQPMEEMVQDPVCGMWVPISQAISLSGEKETRYFCCRECRDKFLGQKKNG